MSSLLRAGKAFFSSQLSAPASEMCRRFAIRHSALVGRSLYEALCPGLYGGLCVVRLGWLGQWTPLSAVGA